MSRYGLSKSRIAAFEQCPRRLWLQVHRPELGEFTEGLDARMTVGNEVGEVACSLYTQGVMVEADPDLDAALAKTASLIGSDHPGPIFEGTFQHEGLLVRVDILERERNRFWRMAEVKSSTGIKDYHRGDLATQVWVLGEAGIELSGAAIRHLDRDFVLEREGDYRGLFRDAELMGEVAMVAQERMRVITEARAVLSGLEPAREPGDHCSRPHSCEFFAHCCSHLPQGPEWPVTLLPNGSGKRWAERGYADLLELKESQLSPRDSRILLATRSGEPFHDADGARKAMAQWSFPRAWLDFETIAPAVPRWIGTRPFQQVPFQFSLHLEDEDGAITHHEFLRCDGSDPRASCAAALVQAIPPEATIIAYHAPFERRVLRELAEACSEHAEALLMMAERTVDLLPVARNHWYHRDQRGSWSIKAVLPTIAPLDYSALEVKDGGDAQAAWAEAAHPDTSPMRRRALEKALSVYCERDTWAMVLIARRLGGQGEWAS